MPGTARLVALIATGALIAAACTTNGGGGGTAAPSSGLVARVSYAGGFIMPIYDYLRLPTVSVYADGRIIAEGPQIEIYPGPLLPAIVAYQLPDGAVDRILADAEAADLTDEDVHYPATMVADAPDTVITIRIDGRTVVSSFNALGADEGASPEEKAEREQALAFVNGLQIADTTYGPAVGSTEDFVPDAIRLLVQDGAPLNEDPQLSQQPADWPLDTPLGSFGAAVDNSVLPDVRCGIVSGDDLATLWPALMAANQLTPWQSDGGEYTLMVRPILPDEPATCD
jgi:hypothetical protein